MQGDDVLLGASPAAYAEWVARDFQRLRSANHSAVMKKCDVVFLRGDGAKPSRYIVNVLNKTFTVELDEGKVVDLMTGKDAGEKLSYVILEYLLGEGAAGQDSWQPLDTLLKTSAYLSYYQKTVLNPLLKTFGNQALLFEESSRMLGGKREKLGGTAYSFTFLPKVRLLIQVWFGDETEMRKTSINASYNMSAAKFLKPTPLLIAFEILTTLLTKTIKKQKT
ncbi:hypothetical protein HRbin03_00090 [archaeon HR03]|nr:hypothetical protein HRbin03_00090 [archaeon HR03]